MCFSLVWAEQLCIYLVVAIAVIAIIKLLLPWAFAQLGGGDGGIIVAIIRIVLWAVVAVFVIYLVFALLGCLTGGGPLLFPRR